MRARQLAEIHGHVSITEVNACFNWCDLCKTFLPTALSRSQADAEEDLVTHLKHYHKVKRPRITVDSEPHPLFVRVSRD